MAGKGWTFVTLPPRASAKLPARGRVAVRGAINGFPFRTSAFPDGKGSHQFMVNAAMRTGAGVAQGDIAKFLIEPVGDHVKVKIPADLRAALQKSTQARARFASITPKARAEWVLWITSAKTQPTRLRRVQQTLIRLLAGKNRPSD